MTSEAYSKEANQVRVLNLDLKPEVKAILHQEQQIKRYFKSVGLKAKHERPSFHVTEQSTL